MYARGLIVVECLAPGGLCTGIALSTNPAGRLRYVLIWAVAKHLSTRRFLHVISYATHRKEYSDAISVAAKSRSKKSGYSNNIGVSI